MKRISDQPSAQEIWAMKAIQRRGEAPKPPNKESCLFCEATDNLVPISIQYADGSVEKRGSCLKCLSDNDEVSYWKDTFHCKIIRATLLKYQ